VRMEQPDVITIFRNALLLSLGQPIVTFLLLVILAVVGILSTFLAILLVLVFPPVLALASCGATEYLLEKAQAVQEKRGKGDNRD